MKDKRLKEKLSSLGDMMTPLAAAWDMLIEIPCPFKGKKAAEDADSQLVMLSFPVIGALTAAAGLFIFIVLSFFMGRLLLSISAAVIFAALLEFLTSCRNLSCASSFFENRFSGLSSYESFLELNGEFNTNRTPAGSISLMMLFLFRVFCLAMLFYHNSGFWILSAMTASYAVQAHLAAAEDINSGKRFLEADDSMIIKTWILAFIISVVFSLHVTAPLLSVVAAFLGASMFRKYCETILEGVSSGIISFAGYISETLLLLLGVLVLVRS